MCFFSISSHDAFFPIDYCCCCACFCVCSKSPSMNLNHTIFRQKHTHHTLAHIHSKDVNSSPFPYFMVYLFPSKSCLKIWSHTNNKYVVFAIQIRDDYCGSRVKYNFGVKKTQPMHIFRIYVDFMGDLWNMIGFSRSVCVMCMFCACFGLRVRMCLSMAVWKSTF